MAAPAGSLRRTAAGSLPKGVTRGPSGDASQTPSIRPLTTSVGEIHPCGRDTADLGPVLIRSSCRVLPTTGRPGAEQPAEGERLEDRAEALGQRFRNSLCPMAAMIASATPPGSSARRRARPAPLR